MSRLTIVIQEKGGVAKTSIAVHATTYLAKQGYKVRPVDMDLSEGMLRKVFPHPESASVNPDIGMLNSGESRLPELMERVLKGSPFLIDCGANTGDAWQILFTRIWPDLPKQLAAAGVKVTVLVPVTRDPKTMKSLEGYKTLFSFATVVMIVYRNFPDEKFELPNHPTELTIELPLAVPALFSTYQTHLMPFDKIAETEEESLKFMRGFARGYVPRLHAMFDKIKPHLMP